MATPASRVFVLYIDDRSAQTDAEPPRTSAPLDEVARRGCSGFLIVDGVGKECSGASVLAAVLGAHQNSTDGSDRFPYPKMPVAFFSTSQAMCKSAKALGLSDVQLAEASNREEAMRRIKELTLAGDASHKHAVFFHLTSSDPDHYVYDVLATILGEEDSATSEGCFVSVIRTADHRHHAALDPALTTHPLRPRQSYERHKGQYPTVAPTTAPLRLLLSSYHCDRTRRDQATVFTEDEIDTHGAYGAMDARVFMSEIAFRLGMAPKYGA